MVSPDRVGTNGPPRVARVMSVSRFAGACGSARSCSAVFRYTRYRDTAGDSSATIRAFAYGRDRPPGSPYTPAPNSLGTHRPPSPSPFSASSLPSRHRVRIRSSDTSRGTSTSTTCTSYPARSS